MSKRRKPDPSISLAQRTLREMRGELRWAPKREKVSVLDVVAHIRKRREEIWGRTLQENIDKSHFQGRHNEQSGVKKMGFVWSASTVLVLISMVHFVRVLTFYFLSSSRYNNLMGRSRTKRGIGHCTRRAIVGELAPADER
eukprot:TRINITY_DN8061_c0_g2_i1.p1 TRINITY_DN8061_c0_g2~~TRINITY_DN8061_c0_g2_i1.p1  ORF type:complete len:141 (-),score=16.15 TRINITY_DN8061_c0_g2_i1:492-914(-)